MNTQTTTQGTTLRTKLIMMLVAACAMVLAVACASFVFYDRSSSGESKQRTMTVLADTMAGSIAGAVAFGDGEAGNFVLAKLAAEDTAMAAAVYDKDGKKLSGWQRTKGDALPEARDDAAQGSVDSQLFIDRPILSEGNHVGTMRLLVSTRDLDARTRRFLTMTGLIFLVCIVMAVTGAMRLHRFITEPVHELSKTAAEVQETKNYSLRATAKTNDELGLLTHAFNSMLQSVQERDVELEQHRTNLAQLVDERTAALKQRTEEMRMVFDTVDQGFVMLDRKGRMARERSARFDAWFGAPEPGALFAAHLDALCPGFGDEFEMCWAQLVENFLPLDVTVGQMIARLRLRDRIYKLAYTPMLTGDVVDGALVAITDITDAVAAEARQAAQREFVTGVTRLIADRAGFGDFVEESERLVAALADDEPAALRRTLHTLKGTGALFGVESLSAICHRIENELAENEAHDIHARVLAVWNAYSERMRPFLGEHDDSAVVAVERHELSSLAKRLDEGLSVEAAVRMLRYWLMDPVAPRMRLLAQRGEVLAQRLGKTNVRFAIDDRGVRLPKTQASRLWGVAVHLLRNALDHGVDDAESRRAAGKDAVVTLSFRAQRDEAATTLEFSDDGGGIDWAKVASKSRLQTPTRKQLVDALFSDGFSTRDAASETSGRGVGLSAVAEVVQAFGGDIEVESELGRGTTFRIRVPLSAGAAQRAA